MKIICNIKKKIWRIFSKKLAKLVEFRLKNTLSKNVQKFCGKKEHSKLQLMVQWPFGWIPGSQNQVLISRHLDITPNPRLLPPRPLEFVFAAAVLSLDFPIRIRKSPLAKVRFCCRSALGVLGSGQSSGRPGGKELEQHGFGCGNEDSRACSCSLSSHP